MSDLPQATIDLENEQIFIDGTEQEFDISFEEMAGFLLGQEDQGNIELETQ